MPACADPRPPPLASARDWQEIFALLDSALELDPAAHPGWLESLGPEHARLVPLLKELLQAHAQGDSGSFLQGPASFAFADPVHASVSPVRLTRSRERTCC